MIVTGVFSAISSVLTWILGLMPSVSLPDASTAISAVEDSRIWQYLAWANWYTPLDLALTLMAARIALAIGMFGFEFLTWAATKLHLLGGSSN